PVLSKSGQFIPGLTTVARSKERCILDAGEDRVRIGQRWLQVPDSFELPGLRCAVVPLMSSGLALVFKFITDCFPGLAAVIGPLDLLAEPAACLRNVQSILINRRSLCVIDFPSGEVGSADIPLLALTVGSQNKCTFSSADQYS